MISVWIAGIQDPSTITLESVNWLVELIPILLKW